MKKNLVAIALITFLSGCTYNYTLDIAKNTPDNQLATITFSDHLKVSEIDGKPFERSFGILPGGSHTLKLPPGEHSFRLSYSFGSVYTKGENTITEVLEAGEKYEIYFVFKDKRIYYGIRNLENKQPRTAEEMRFGETCYGLDQDKRARAKQYMKTASRNLDKLKTLSANEKKKTVTLINKLLIEAAKIGSPEAFLYKCKIATDALKPAAIREEELAWCKVGLKHVPILSKALSKSEIAQVNDSTNTVLETEIGNMLCKIPL